jgi:hypothetical protein
MEYVHGITLKRWLSERGPMAIEQFVPFFVHVAEVVQTAHERGIVHRDLKPSNVMVIERAGRLLPTLLDIGVAKLREGELLPASTPETLRRLRALMVAKVPEEVRAQFRVGASTVTDDSPSSQPGGQGRLTPDHATLGTPGYMAPEQWNRSAAVGASADIFALGVVAFEVLTGRRPFEGMAVAASADLDLRAMVPALGGRFPPALDRVFQRALATRPEERWDSALELAGALRAASGIGATRAELPRIDHDVREAWLAEAPPPLAESLAELDDAHNVHQARDLAEELIRSLLRYLLAKALAMNARVDDGHGDPVLLELVRALATRTLGIDERVALLRLLVRRRTGANGAHPLPELLALVTPNLGGTDGLDPILALYAASDRAVTEGAVRWQLLRLIPLLTELLLRTRFVLDHALVVSRNHAAERWAGRRHQPRARTNVPGGEVLERHPMLLDPAGRVCLDLWPLVQAVAPIEGADPELYLFDGHGRRGAVLVGSLSGFDYHDPIARDWLATRVIAEIERKTRMRDQIRVAAQQWQDRARPDALLWRGEVLAELERWTRHAADSVLLSNLELAFVAACRRVGRRARWIRRLLVAAVIGGVVAGVEYRAAWKTHMAEQIATQAEVEQGRQSLLHGESRPTLKLVVRRETLRVIASVELVRIVGGGSPDGQLFDTASPVNGCPNALVQPLDMASPATGSPNIGAVRAVKP